MVSVGRIARAHGNKGRVIVDPDSDFVDERFRSGSHLYVHRDGRIDRLSICDVRFHQHRPILGFEEVSTMTEAEALTAMDLRIPEENLRALPDGSFYHHELIGCSVLTLGGTMVGIVRGIEGNAELCRLVVGCGAAEVQIPMVSQICVSVDPEARQIRIDPPDGLLGLNQFRGEVRAAGAG